MSRTQKAMKVTLGVIVTSAITLVAIRAWFVMQPAPVHKLPCPACGRPALGWFDVFGGGWRVNEAHSARVRCGRVLRIVDGAMQQWALENRKPQDAMPDWSDVIPYCKAVVLQPGMNTGGMYDSTLVISNGVGICKHGGGPLVLGSVRSGPSCPLGTICPEHRR